MKNTQKHLPFTDDLYSNPVEFISGKTRENETPVKLKGVQKARKVLPESTQPYLPGLSRRGRPRSRNPLAPSMRASASRKRRMEAGVKRVELLLEPAVASELEALAAHFKVSRVEIISRLIGKAAKRIRDKLTEPAK